MGTLCFFLVTSSFRFFNIYSHMTSNYEHISSTHYKSESTRVPSLKYILAETHIDCMSSPSASSSSSPSYTLSPPISPTSPIPNVYSYPLLSSPIGKAKTKPTQHSSSRSHHFTMAKQNQPKTRKRKKTQTKKKR